MPLSVDIAALAALQKAIDESEPVTLADGTKVKLDWSALLQLLIAVGPQVITFVTQVWPQILEIFKKATPEEKAALQRIVAALAGATADARVAKPVLAGVLGVVDAKGDVLGDILAKLFAGLGKAD